MKQQQVVWTALPNGIKDGRLRLSVFVSPRLKTDEVPAGQTSPLLGQFPDFVAWPSRAIQFAVHFEGGPTLPAVQVSPPPDLALWQRLFKEKTPVRSYQFDKLDERVVRSYPVKHVMGFLKKQYQRSAVESPSDFPATKDLVARTDSLLQIGFYQPPPTGAVLAVPQNREAQLTQQLETQLRRTKAIPPRPEANPPLDFLEVKLFHETLLNAPDPKNPRERLRAVVKVPDLDFHQMLSSLGDYPELLRRLGLIIDLEVTPTPAVSSATRVWVEPKWTSPPAVPTDNTTPRTRCQAKGMFVAQPRGAEITNGMLRVRDPQKGPDAQPYDVVQVDVDGAALKAMHVANNILRSLAPAHKSADTPDSASLPAMRTGGLSLALHGRATQLVGILKLARQNNDAVESDPSSDVTLFAEDLIRGYRIDILDGAAGKWRSLCARVGSYHFLDGGNTEEITDEGWVSTATTHAADNSNTDLHLPEALFRWTGWSLAAPRPGRRLDPEDKPADFTNKSGTDLGLEVNFRAASQSLPRLRFGTGYQVRARVVDLAGNSLTLDEADALVAKAAVAAQAATEAIRYVRFEPIPSPVTLLRKSIQDSPGESVERLVIRSYNDKPSKDTQNSKESTERHVAPPLAAELLAETHGMFDTPGGLDPNAYNTIVAREGTFLVGGNSAKEQVHPEGQLQVPYLPDPFSRGATLVGLPGPSPAKPVRVDFTGKWPDTTPFRIKLVEGDAAPKWDPGDRVLTVGIPKGDMMRVRLSSYLTQDDLKLMGMLGWITEAGVPSAQRDTAVNLALAGQHWMVTPFRELVLVHAVQQPLIVPQFRSLTANRGIGQTYATLYDKFPISGKSTAKLDILAEWKEPIDALADPEWHAIPGKAHVRELPVQIDATEADIVRLRHEFGDTKHRRVTYTAVATTRFREYFPFTDEQIASGETPITRISDPKDLDILSSARPDSPKVLYVVPTFGWQQAKTADGKSSTRSGGGLRVYMERPWFSSGDGELLGVVLPQLGARRIVLSAVTSPGLGTLAPYVTQWGADPLWLSTVARQSPPPDAFKRAVATEQNLTLDELEGAKVTVVGHEPAYDADRQLWYCDIDIDPGEAYYPFIRLALARYQPKSVQTPNGDVKLSRVVLADFAQLTPDRAASVGYVAGDPTAVNVSLLGVTYRGSEVGRGPSVAEVSVETRRPGVEGDLGWVPVSDAVFPLEPRAISDTRTLWTGKATLPSPRGSKPFRLVIREYELFRGTGRAAAATSAILAIPRPDRRLVYADAIEI